MNTLLHGFTEIRQAPLPELDATLHEMEHTQTGARLVWLERDEENKTFGIAFPTLPKGDTASFISSSTRCSAGRTATGQGALRRTAQTLDEHLFERADLPG